MWNELKARGCVWMVVQLRDLLSQLEERKAAMAERGGTVSGSMR